MTKTAIIRPGFPAKIIKSVKNMVVSPGKRLRLPGHLIKSAFDIGNNQFLFPK